jgi:hypothetical protein
MVETHVHKAAEKTITFSCKKGACTPSAHHAHIGSPGNTVALTAQGTDVTITFTAGSPFATPVIHITAGQTTHEPVVNPGTFEYKPACSACPSTKGTPPAPPQMIVP